MSQHMEALGKAHARRIPRAEKKRQIKALLPVNGRARVAEIVLHPGELWEAARLSYVLRMPRKSGTAFVIRVCDRVGVVPDMKLKDLTGRQRLAVAMLLHPETACGVVVGEAE